MVFPLKLLQKNVHENVLLLFNLRWLWGECIETVTANIDLKLCKIFLFVYADMGLFWLDPKDTPNPL